VAEPSTVSAFRPDLLSGRVALVTGGGSGIGEGIAGAYAAHGARVAILGRKADRLHAAAERIRESGAECIAVPGDVRDFDAMQAAVATVVERFGGLHVLVNGAAGNFLAPAAQLSSNGFRTVLDIDAVGTFNCSRAAFDRAMRDHGGSIINISATLHYGATHFQVHAAAAKAAVDSVTRTMALEWGPAGVRVNGIAPGPIDDTEGMARLLPPGARSRLENAIPMRRTGRIHEIAQVALFLASDAASLVTGAVVVADGGACLPAAMSLSLALGG
jgi:peroxisomal 2,4-dienoyl-CoA reductase